MMILNEKLILNTFKNKGYKFFSSPFSVNIFGIRMETNTNLFDDLICIAFYDDNKKFNFITFEATTDPGVDYLKKPLSIDGCAIMVEGQYLGAFKLGPHGSTKYLACRQNKPIPVYRDNNRDTIHDMSAKTIKTGIYYTNIHHGWSAKVVGNNSGGCQVIKSKTRFEKEFLPLVQKSVKLYGEDFTYTLFNKKDFS